MGDSHRKRRRVADKDGVTRRDLLTSAGIGAVGLAAGASAGQAAEAEPAASGVPAGEMMQVVLTINGRARRLMVEPRWSLAYVLRHELGLTAAKAGCGRGECGSCTVLIDGIPRYSCMTLAPEAEGREVTTLEGLLQGEELSEVQEAFAEKDAFQCGYCTPGQIMAVEGLLLANPNPDLDEIRTGVSGNLCRCGAYTNIFRAAGRAAELKRERGGRS